MTKRRGQGILFMKKIIGTFTIAATLLTAGGAFVAVAFAQVATTTASSTVSAATSSAADDLQSQINQKTQQLNTVKQQLTTTQTTLKTVQQQKTTLQQQIKSIQGNITVLNLGVKADQVHAEQLGLQVQQLQGDIVQITAEIDAKKGAIASLLQSLQRNDTTNGNLLAIFLKNGDLATSAMEAQGVLNLQGQLSSDIGSLTDLENDYNSKIQDGLTKKQGIQQDQVDLQSKMTIAQQEAQQQADLLASTKNKESVFQQQLTDLQKQQEEIDAQIEALDSALRAKINPNSIPNAVAGILLVPIAGETKADITQGYGATSFAKNGYKGQWHNGVDLAASIGTPVLAAADGTISGVGNNDAYCPHQQYGKYITINFNNNLTGVYGHLSLQSVKVGDVVKRGQVIGYSGRTGYATGPHLHFTIFAQSTFYIGPSNRCGPMPYGGDINPIPYLF